MSPQTLFPKLLAAILGDADTVMKNADEWQSTTQWRWWQTTQAAGAAVGSSLIPVTGLITTPASMIFTYRKMAHIAWATGRDLDAHVEPLDDMLLITGLWTGAVTKSSLNGARLAAPLITPGLLGYAKISLEGLKNGVPAEELALTALVERALPGFCAKLGLKVGADGAKQAVSRAVPILGAGVSGGLTLASCNTFSKHATQFYTRKREALGPQ